MASMGRLAGGLGKLLLSLAWLTGPVIGVGRWTSPVSVETHAGREGSVFHAMASVERPESGKRWTLRLEVRGPRSADESE